MATIDATMVKELREKSGAGIMDCKQALTENDGDMEKAVDFLRKKGLATAAKRAGRATSEGTVQSYIHMGGKIGVMIEVNCETDFVAKNEDFTKFCKDVVMHIVAANPLYLNRNEVANGDIPEKETPEDFYKRTCLQEQAFIKDEKMTIGDYLNSLIAKTGENVVIRRFMRFVVGETA